MPLEQNKKFQNKLLHRLVHQIVISSNESHISFKLSVHVVYSET